MAGDLTRRMTRRNLMETRSTQSIAHGRAEWSQRRPQAMGGKGAAILGMSSRCGQEVAMEQRVALRLEKARAARLLTVPGGRRSCCEPMDAALGTHRTLHEFSEARAWMVSDEAFTKASASRAPGWASWLKFYHQSKRRLMRRARGRASRCGAKPKVD